MSGGGHGGHDEHGGGHDAHGGGHDAHGGGHDAHGAPAVDEAAFNKDLFVKRHADLQKIEDTIDFIHQTMEAQAMKSIIDEDGYVQWRKLNTKKGRQAYYDAAVKYIDEEAPKVFQANMKGVDEEFSKSMYWQQMVGMTKDQYKKYIEDHKSNWKNLRDRLLPQIADRAKSSYRSVVQGMVDNYNKKSALETMLGDEAKELDFDQIEADQAYQLMTTYAMQKESLQRYYKEKTH
ncbi:MAG: hypothetical protein NDI94_03215 [Candidatus Woesearchaeota archaeon]|nr:hypothetical protein [Candidatus Woesearchaeota archaeon]